MWKYFEVGAVSVLTVAIVPLQALSVEPPEATPAPHAVAPVTKSEGKEPKPAEPPVSGQTEEAGSHQDASKGESPTKSTKVSTTPDADAATEKQGAGPHFEITVSEPWRAIGTSSKTITLAKQDAPIPNQQPVVVVARSGSKKTQMAAMRASGTSFVQGMPDWEVKPPFKINRLTIAGFPAFETSCKAKLRETGEAQSLIIIQVFADSGTITTFGRTSTESEAENFEIVRQVSHSITLKTK